MVTMSLALDVSDTNILQGPAHLHELVSGKNFKFSCERKFHAHIEHAGFICLINDVESSAREQSGNAERGHCQKTSLVNLLIRFYDLTLSTKRFKAAASRDPA